MIGSYQCIFNSRSKFIYMCKTRCEGYSIRKHDWIDIIKTDPEIFETIKHNEKFYYEYHVLYKVNTVKESVLLRQQKRADYH
jgi:hypothetical protein